MTFDTLHAALFTAAFLVPGFIWTAVLSMVVPRRSTAEQHRIIEFLTFSCINYGVWSWLIVLLFYDGFIWNHPLWTAFFSFVIVCVSPVVLGMLSGQMQQKRWMALLLGRFGINTIHPIPTAWDYQFSQGLPYWVIVTLSDGSIIYGLFGYYSFAGDDPAERDLYIESVYTVADNGAWIPVENSGGVVLKSDRIALIEFRKVMEINYGKGHTEQANSDSGGIPAGIG